MFRHVTLDTWNGIIPIAAFAATAVVFGLFFFIALRMKKGDAERMAKLPLTPETNQSSNPVKNHE